MSILISTINDAIHNIQTLETYNTSSEKESRFYKGNIGQAKALVSLKSGDKYLFGSCNFVAYLNNERIIHKQKCSNAGNNNSSRPVKKSIKCLQKLLGEPHTSGKVFKELNVAYKKHCKDNTIEPSREEGTKRYYWLIEQPFDTLEAYYAQLQKEVSTSQKESSEKRQARLAKASRKPSSFMASTKVFRRNNDVIAEVLLRSRGYCERCKKEAPFLRASDREPYLEVHHIIQLCDDGDDTVENAVALCPNCHRESHYGMDH
jgi:predicted HNH restriction endonuclease